MSEQSEITNNSGEECYEKGIWKTNTVLQCPQIPNFEATRQSEGGDHADRVPVLGDFNQKSCLDSLLLLDKTTAHPILNKLVERTGAAWVIADAYQ